MINITQMLEVALKSLELISSSGGHWDTHTESFYEGLTVPALLSVPSPHPVPPHFWKAHLKQLLSTKRNKGLAISAKVVSASWNSSCDRCYQKDFNKGAVTKWNFGTESLLTSMIRTHHRLLKLSPGMNCLIYGGRELISWWDTSIWGIWRI